MRLKRLTCATLALALAAMPAAALPQEDSPDKASSGPPTATPIEHIVVIFQENVSFDHYFATYPVATNPSEEPAFTAAPDTPAVNGLTGLLLTNNPNLNTANNTMSSAGATNPFRLDRSQAATADQDHDYGPEQMAFDGGLMDLFPASVGTAGTPPSPPPPIVETTGLTMGYYDGNTVTALWNYAQHFAMSDNSFGTNFGPSTVGAINLVSGQTNGVTVDNNPGGATVSDGNGGLTDVGDADPAGDMCSTTTGETLHFGGTNIGDLLNKANITWGWFHGGFNLAPPNNSNGTVGCTRTTKSAVTGVTKVDYIQHHEPFQYYTTTQNLAHTPPTKGVAIGAADPTGANHQYDLSDFTTALSADALPAVSFLKARGFQEGHPGYSDPLDEQTFIVDTVNAIEQSKEWKSTLIVINWDDSDGFYDHQMSPIVNQSATAMDELNGPGKCGNGDLALPGVNPATTHAQGRCGYGPRIPMLVISPYAKTNFVDHTLTSQTSIIRFIEDNWLSGARIGEGSFDASTNSIAGMLDFTGRIRARQLYLDDSTGEVLKRPPKS